MDVEVIELQKDSVQLTKDTTLSAKEFYQHDPLLLLLKEKLHLNNLWISAGTVLLPGIIYLIWGLLSLANKSFVLDTNDWLSIIIQMFILFPLLFFIYTFIPESVAKLFNTLYANGVIGHVRPGRTDTETYAHFKQYMISWIDNKSWTVANIAIIIIYVILKLSVLHATPYQSHNIQLAIIIRLVAIVIYVPLMFATGMNVIRLILVLIFINRLFYIFTFQIKPRSTDSSGGLGSMKRLLWLYVGMMLWLAILLVAAILASGMIVYSYPEKFLLAGIYMALIPALLIGWWLLPHRMMVNARNEILHPLALEYQHALIQSLSSGTQDTQRVMDETLRLEALKKRYDLLYDSFYVWPLEISTLRNVGVTVILPVILPLIFPFVISFISDTLQRLGF